ncbi:MAG: UbiD family decarboxylase, partial [Methanobacterium sp.]|nr:UbiD family decarboxylase [Methanobacterium sp.]
MRRFLKTLEKDFNTIKIDEKVSVNLEAAEFLKKNPKDTIIMENIRESDM